MNKVLMVWALSLMLPFLLGGKRAQDPRPELVSPVRNVILMIGDGMGLTQVSAAMIASGNKLALARCKHIGLITTYAHDDLITDSAAGGTAFATGKKTYNGAIGIGPDRRKLRNIVEIASDHHLSTGVVTTSSIQHATPAAFYAHSINRYFYDDVSLNLLNTPLNLAIGGGERYFTQRRDSLKLLDSMRSRGYEVFTSLKKARKEVSGDKLLVLAAPDHLPKMKEKRGDYLPDAAMLAIERLNRNPKGFFLMIEGAQIDFGGHDNDSDYVVQEMLDFDETIGKVLDFAAKEGNTLVIITGDHETGGAAIEGESLGKRKVVLDFTTGGHTATMVPVFAFGPGAEAFTGFYDNTDIFQKMLAALRLKR